LTLALKLAKIYVLTKTGGQKVKTPNTGR